MLSASCACPSSWRISIVTAVRPISCSGWRTVTQINAALAGGQDLLFTPGVYQINGTIDVTNPDTVVLGLGLATLVSNGGSTIMQTADVNGVRIGGLI